VSSPPRRPWFVDALGQWLGLVHEAPGRLRLTVRPELLNSGGLLAGPVVFALVDYAMGSVLWDELDPPQGMATSNVAINFVATAGEGDVVCVARVDRRTRAVAALGATVTAAADERLLATAIGSYVVLPRMPDRLTPPPGLRPAYP
jgi:acyl-coenzyme A thioesterase PaaI-like protein